MRGRENSMGARYHPTFSVNGYRARDRRPNPTHLLRAASGMFHSEDALGQVNTMSLDNQRNLKLAFSKASLFMKVSETVASEMNKWAKGFFGRTIVADWREQLNFTTRIFRARGLHLDDRHIRDSAGAALA